MEIGARATATIDVRLLDGQSDLDDVTRLFDQIWGRNPSAMPGEILRAFTLGGEYIAGAYDGDELIAAAVAFFGVRDGHLHLHSHIAGVVPRARGSNVGYLLKQHQRDFARDHGVHAISWTFDPLVRRNAYFNLTKLGARADRFLLNFYGAMEDSVNAGDESDRILAVWPVLPDSSADVVTDPAELNALAASRDAIVVLRDEGGRPVASAQCVGGSPWLVQVPDDIVALRAADPGVARSWRYALRSALVSALDDGLVIRGITRSGWYVLGRPI